MTKTELKARAWKVLDDNPLAPQYILDVDMGLLLDEAVADLSAAVREEVSAALTVVAGVAAVPTDYAGPLVLVEDNGNPLTIITDPSDRFPDDAACAQVYMPNIYTINLYGKTPSGVVTAWYVKKLAFTVGTLTLPSVPERFHRYIAEVFVKRTYYQITGDEDSFAKFDRWWEQIKNQVGAECQRIKRPNGIFKVVSRPWR